jgi:hypothetical protein
LQLDRRVEANSNNKHCNESGLGGRRFHEIDQVIGIRFGPFSPTVFGARVAIKLRRASCSPDLPGNGGEYLQLVGTITSPQQGC